MIPPIFCRKEGDFYPTVCAETSHPRPIPIVEDYEPSELLLSFIV